MVKQELILMLLVANLANTKMMEKSWKIIETLANGYSYDSARPELSNEYQHDRVKMIFTIFLLFCALDESNLSIRKVKYLDTPVGAPLSNERGNGGRREGRWSEQEKGNQ